MIDCSLHALDRCLSVRDWAPEADQIQEAELALLDGDAACEFASPCSMFLFMSSPGRNLSIRTVSR